jgi:hypothetical protein
LRRAERVFANVALANASVHGNSSPPMRATQSMPLRNCFCSRAPNCFSTRSPPV